jgi:hypothetical protein
MSKRDLVREVGNTFKCPGAKDNGPCKSEFQDGRYGQGVRIFTPVAEKTTGGDKRCTVCDGMA